MDQSGFLTPLSDGKVSIVLFGASGKTESFSLTGLKGNMSTSTKEEGRRDAKSNDTSDGTLHPNSFNMISNGISQDQLPFMSFPQPFVAHVEVLKCEGEPAVVRVLANRTLDVLTQLSSHWILVDSSGSICLKLDQNLNETGLTTQQLANRKKMREEDRRWSVPEQIEEEDRSHKKDEKELQAVPIDAQKTVSF
ncbi:hypothetical protein BLNAU_4281 [Blattamonas nauphoetae]|uniref:Uncharacterized protein n=1 Tax=Blattamonas nauphoetae TaxID=2049346 RepID=A0ABQ9YAZ7_9EUKA|nr:hypothetical protein BLNAU_4281 [Blattamonas nauphoetae]